MRQLTFFDTGTKEILRAATRRGATVEVSDHRNTWNSYTLECLSEQEADGLMVQLCCAWQADTQASDFAVHMLWEDGTATRGDATHG